MATLSGTTGQFTYVHVVNHVLKTGVERTPRGQKTLDAGFTTIELETPFRALPLGVGRFLNKNIAAAEAIQLIGGFSWPDLLTKATTSFSRYSEADGTFHGAYGQRIGYQCLCAINKISKDIDTRQAVISLWDPWLDNLPDKHDYPCTCMLQFEVRDSRLCMNVVMRSNDVWLGLPYDMFQFTQLQISVANALGMLCGMYRHTALSLHIYDRNIDDALLLRTEPQSSEDQPAGLGIFGSTPFTSIMKRARQLAGRFTPDNETSSERWYRERFASYMG